MLAGPDTQISGGGRSQLELVGALAGKGVNLASLVRNVFTAFLDAQAGHAQEIDFSQLSGNFTMDKSLMRNRNLSLLAPLLRVGRAGTVESQGIQAQTDGIMVPVLIEGPWTALS